eukprot:TRINITY_DN51813_c0_g1_i1.p1 TRINITY_DN51813_c0_g1~~TRINITY_DN51813_c0_g1_i1.p1  ORF type:complete len:308 (+),score=94.68 TRINITY_DN51813_c0_g1_i1:88-924(+)
MASPLLVSATSAAAGGLLSTATLYPLDMLRSLLAADAKGERTVAETLREVGVKGLYSGVQYKACQVSLCKFIFFYVYEAMQAAYLRVYGVGFSPSANLAAGYVSDLAMVPVTLPIECVITKMQVSSRAGKAASLRDIVREVQSSPEGILSLYSGVHWQLLVSLLAALQQTVFDQIRPRLLAGRASLTALEALVLGACSRLLALVFIYPFIKLKTLVQSGADADSILETCRRNPRSLYRGFGPEALRGVLSSALLFMVKEKLHQLIVSALSRVAARPKA